VRGRVLVAALIAIVLVVFAGAAAFAYSNGQTAAQHADAKQQLDSVRQRDNAVRASLTDPALQAELTNVNSLQEARTAMGDYRARLGGAIKTVENKLAELRQERDRLRAASRNPLLFTNRQELERDRDRVEAATKAFESAETFLTIGDNHAKVFNAILAALLELDNINAYVEANDLSGAAALVPQLKQQLQSTATAAQGVNAVPPLRALIDALSRIAADVDQALAALQSNDNTALGRLEPAFRADVDAVNAAFDAQKINAAIHQQLDPYRVRYQTEMQKAGFTITGISTS
jgi:hypothetical protein